MLANKDPTATGEPRVRPTPEKEKDFHECCCCMLQTRDPTSRNEICCCCFPLRLGINLLGIGICFELFFGLLENIRCYTIFSDGIFPSVSWAAYGMLSGVIYYLIKYWRDDNKHNREGLVNAALLKIGADTFILLWSFIYFLGVFDIYSVYDSYKPLGEDTIRTMFMCQFTFGYFINLALWIYYYFKIKLYAKSYDDY